MDTRSYALDRDLNDYTTLNYAARLSLCYRWIMARMTKADIIESVYEKVGGFSKKEAAEIVETVFNVVKETLERGEKIKISGFGNFVVRDKKDRMGRDPQRAVPILIPARRVLTFKPSQVLKNILNGLPPV
jgi:integration host factor subunit alpha